MCLIGRFCFKDHTTLKVYAIGSWCIRVCLGVYNNICWLEGLPDLPCFLAARHGPGCYLRGAMNAQLSDSQAMYSLGTANSLPAIPATEEMERVG